MGEGENGYRRRISPIKDAQALDVLYSLESSESRVSFSFVFYSFYSQGSLNSRDLVLSGPFVLSEYDDDHALSARFALNVSLGIFMGLLLV